MTKFKTPLHQAWVEAGYKSASAAWRENQRALGVGKDLFISNSNGNRDVSKASAETYSRVFGRDPAWYLYEKSFDLKLERFQPVSVGAPLISWVSAGALLQPDVQAYVEDEPIVYAPDLDSNGDWIALRVDGDSMNRISPHDSIIFVNRKDRKLVPNACYVIGDGEGGATYKRYRPPNTWEPVSTNKAHKPMELPDGQEPDIIGRVKKTVLSM